MKILALDLGDKWVGSALSDALSITCKPYKTTILENLTTFITETLQEEPIDTIIIGLPLTIKGTQSAQTKKVMLLKNSLEEKFKNITWILWDERYTSKRANEIISKRKKSHKKNKQNDHVLAAAFILQSYLDSKSF
jgi:putative holliday junction resolvase